MIKSGASIVWIIFIIVIDVLSSEDGHRSRFHLKMSDSQLVVGKCGARTIEVDTKTIDALETGIWSLTSVENWKKVVSVWWKASDARRAINISNEVTTKGHTGIQAPQVLQDTRTGTLS
jgi:hypothetical protein